MGVRPPRRTLSHDTDLDEDTPRRWAEELDVENLLTRALEEA